MPFLNQVATHMKATYGRWPNGTAMDPATQFMATERKFDSHKIQLFLCCYQFKKKITVKWTERHFLCSRGMQTSSKQRTALLWLKYSYHNPPASRRLSPLQARLNFTSESYSSQSRFVASPVVLTGKNMPSQKLFCLWKKGFSEIPSWDGGFCESHLRCYQVIKRNHLWTAWRGF